MGVTSSIRPMRMPALANALKADWAPGPGVFDPFPTSQFHPQNTDEAGRAGGGTSSSADLDV